MCHALRLLLGDWLSGRADMAPDISIRKRVYMWFLIIRGSRDVWIWFADICRLQAHCLSDLETLCELEHEGRGNRVWNWCIVPTQPPIICFISSSPSSCPAVFAAEYVPKHMSPSFFAAVVLSGPKPFKGFLCQSLNWQTRAAVGTFRSFSLPKQTRLSSCPRQAVGPHSDQLHMFLF